MNRGKLLLFVGLLAYVHSVPSGYETVWLKDVTTTIQTDKRTFDDPDLPAHLTFHIRRGLGFLTLNLKRNYAIDPNADIYVMQKAIDGRSILTKTRNMEKEDVGYYQDMDNGAYMTVRCVKRLSQQCDRVIYGNLQIGDSSYELRAQDTDDTSGNSLERLDVSGERYLLLDQTNIGLENVVGNKDALQVIKTNEQEELNAPFQSINGQENQNYLDLPDATISPRNVGKLYDRGDTDKSRQLKKHYYVKVAVLIDSGVWDLYFSRESTVSPAYKGYEVKRKIREAYAHIMNGVGLRYKSIDDPSLSITVIPQNFIFFMHESLFPHKKSKSFIDNGKKHIDLNLYLEDLHVWDNTTGANVIPEFDIAMLFTTYYLVVSPEGYKPNNTLVTDEVSPKSNGHGLYMGPISSDDYLDGMSFMGGVCDLGLRTSVIQARHYQGTVQTATHELGHSLGADHDGEGDAVACKSEDSFIMANVSKQIKKERPYIRNNWIFSNCSVESFKKTLRNKECVKHPSVQLNTDEWTMKKQPGDVFTPQAQCLLIYGPGSKFYGSMSEELCYLLSCINPAGKKRRRYVNAANGTPCGEHKWCIDGRCVSRRFK